MLQQLHKETTARGEKFGARGFGRLSPNTEELISFGYVRLQDVVEKDPRGGLAKYYRPYLTPKGVRAAENA
jgi:hypothetical protein